MITLQKSRSTLWIQVLLEQKLIFAAPRTVIQRHISYAELKQLSSGHKLLSNIALTTLAAETREFLTEQALAYLAKAERSPYQFRIWLKNRAVPAEWAQTLTARCYQQGFLNAERFAAAFTARRQTQGHKPWRRVQFELERHEIPKELITNCRYDDLTMLKTVYLSSHWGQKLPLPLQMQAVEAEAPHKALQAKLLRQGFAYATVKTFLSAWQTQLETHSQAETSLSSAAQSSSLSH